MYRVIKGSSLVGILALLSLTAFAQRNPYQGSFRTTQQLILRIENRTDVFRNSLNTSLNRGRINRTTRTDDINRAVDDFRDALNRLHLNFDRRQATGTDVQEVLNRAAVIDNYLRQRRLDARTQNDWSNLRVDLNQLARTFRVSWPTDVGTYPPTQSTYPPSQSTYGTNLLTGTYRLDPSRSDDPRDVANRAAQSLPNQDRQRLLDELTARLEAPDQIAIDRRGRTITLASSRAPQITFEADGSQRVETTPDGRTIRAQATLAGDQLIVSSTGNRESEFNVTFNPIDNGRRLSVVRRVYVSGLNTPVVVQSTYDRVSDVASFDIYNGTQTYPSVGSNGDFIVNNGETLVAVLNDPLSTSSAREGDRFTLTVRQPERLAGATIEGHVTNVRRSGRLSGRSDMTLNFDTIRLRDGNSYRFAGIVESVRTPNGDTVAVDNEGTVRDDSQTNKTVQRTAIGTAVGAIIGAIAGGGKGAAIGAIIGAGGGAGSVYVQGRDDLDLSRGTELTIRASGPR